MKIIGTKKQNEAAGALAFVLAVIDKMHKKLDGAETDMYCAALAECFALAEIIGGEVADCLCEYGYTDCIPRLQEWGFGVTDAE